jgi:riboflavin kinase/FMN adenylyltransferase
LKNRVTSLALGSFDGIHRAHKELIKRVDGVLIIERGAVLTPGKFRCKFVDKACFFYNLQQIKHLDAKGFVAQLKKDFPNLKKIVVGYDFAFGKDRKYSILDLKRYFDGEVEVVEEIKIDGVSVHSRVIKELLKKGRIEEANRFLGRCYEIVGEKIKGLGLGSRELVATINIEVENFLLPKEGVYLTLTNSKPSLTFIGKRDTIDGSFSIESHILEDFEEEKEIKICFLKFLRDNKKFDSIKELKSEILKDIKRARREFNESFNSSNFSNICKCR